MSEDTRSLRPDGQAPALLVYLLLLAITAGAAWVASYIQQGYGTVTVTNVTYRSEIGIPMRAKQFRPIGINRQTPAPGVVYIHGYQNNRETSDPLGIELARRGFVVLCIDAIGRGNSGRPLPPDHPDFDDTYGAGTSIAYLKGLDYVDPERVGIMGHSMGASFAYETALVDNTIDALVITGFVFDERASSSVPRNMLTIFGIYDEFRDRMTHCNDVETEWLKSKLAAQTLGHETPEAGKTYGDFDAGTARQVLLPPRAHLMMTHSRAPIAAAISWMRSALEPDPSYWVDPQHQIWWIKELANLVMLITCLFSAMPLGHVSFTHTTSLRKSLKPIAVNGALMWLYLPLCTMIYAVHAFVIRIDVPFPMMIVNSIVWWFFVINVVGILLFKRWISKRGASATLGDLGIPELGSLRRILSVELGKAFLLGMVLFLAIYFSEHVIEQIFLVDLRFVVPFASDLTLDRTLIYPRYFPFILFGFLATGLLVHVRLRLPPAGNRWRTWIGWSLFNTAVMVLPIALFLIAQYGPLLLFGIIPFVGPSGAFASFTMNLFHLAGVFALIMPLSTWFFQLTGKPYVGAVLSSAIVTWMLVSSQVIAPVPV